jgi:hypothetical protein
LNIFHFISFEVCEGSIRARPHSKASISHSGLLEADGEFSRQVWVFFTTLRSDAISKLIATYGIWKFFKELMLRSEVVVSYGQEWHLFVEEIYQLRLPHYLLWIDKLFQACKFIFNLLNRPLCILLAPHMAKIDLFSLKHYSLSWENTAHKLSSVRDWLSSAALRVI